MAQGISGSLKVSNDCIADLAGYAALECYGVIGMAVTDQQEGVVRLLPTYRLRRGVGVSTEDGVVMIDLHVIVEQGVNMSSVCSNLSSAVKFLLKRIAELDNVAVHVHIEGMRASK